MAALKSLTKHLLSSVWAFAVFAGGVTGLAQDQFAPLPPVAAVAPGLPRTRLADLTAIASMNGMIVRDLRFRGASIDNDARLRQWIVQEVGQPLDKNKVRRSIQALYATGRFSDIRVEGERTSQGEITLVFVAEENFFNGLLTVDGMPRRGPTDSQLLNAARLDLGELFTREKLQAGIENMKRVLQDHGFYHASVTAELAPYPATQQMDVHFHVVPGERARVGAVTVTGEAGLTLAQVQDIGKIHPGDSVTSNRATRALERLRKKYKKRDRLEADVALASRTYVPATDTVDYGFRLDQGPTVDVHLEGARLSRGKLKKYVPIYEENAVDDDLLNEGRRNIRDYFQTQGYFDVNVDFRREPVANDHQHVIFLVDRGHRHKLEDVIVRGNKYFDTETIRERMLIDPAGWLLSHGRFSQSMLSRDIEAIESLYRANGFQEAKVTGEASDDYQGKVGRMRVVMDINEGPQTRVQRLTIVGNAAIPEAELRDQIGTLEGQPFSEYNLATDREAIANYYFNRGFPDVSFEASSVADANDPTRMNVTFKIVEGRHIVVDKVLLTGLHYTRPYVAERELQVRDGDPLSLTDMLDTQRRLYDLGIFSEVNLAVQNPEGAAREKNVLVQVTEAKRWTFNYGFGIEIATGSDPGANTPQGRTGVSPRVSFDVTRINFLGRNHTLIFKSRFGRLQQRGLFSYEAPRWFGREDLRLTFSAFYDDTRAVRTFTAQRLEGSAQIEHRYSRVSTFLYRFTYRRVKVDPRTLVIDPNLIPLLSRPVRIGMPSFTYIRDKRDDPIDSHKGSYTTVDTGVASGYFGSEADFSRFLIQNNTYHAFKKNKWVLARATRLGIERPFSDQDFVPLPERFFAGGGNSLRGFPINQAGPRDRETGFPIGGDAMFVNNLELRFPPMALPFVEDNLSTVIFHDMGNVFSTADGMFKGFTRVSQPSKRACELLTLNAVCDLNYMSHAVGAGVRYRTPIGPVRVDFGYNLNPPTFPVRNESRSQTLGRFNFFFSIGQTF